MGHFWSYIFGMNWICWLSLAVLKVVLMKRLKNSPERGELLFTIMKVFLFPHEIISNVFVNSGDLQFAVRYAYPWWKEKVINSELK